VNSNETFMPVAARPRAGISATSLVARPSLGVLAASCTADIREIAPSRAAAGVRMPWLSHAPASVKPRPGFAQRTQNNSAQTYTNAIGAVATGDGQTGSLPAWDPV
jgi:hypothetical protein